MNAKDQVAPLIEHWNGTQWSVSPNAIGAGSDYSGVPSIAAISPAMSGPWPR